MAADTRPYIEKVFVNHPPPSPKQSARKRKRWSRSFLTKFPELYDRNKKRKTKDPYVCPAESWEWHEPGRGRNK